MNPKVKSKTNLERSNIILTDPKNLEDGSLSGEMVVHEVMEFILEEVSNTQNESPDKVSTPLKNIENNYQSFNDDNDKNSQSESSDDDSFYREFPGQHIKKSDESDRSRISPKNSTLDKDLYKTAPPEAKQAVYLINMKKLN